jgi:branched-chain amino acid aminotransferase
MEEHVARLYRSLKYARIDPGISREEFVEVSEEAITRNLHMLSDAGDFNVHQFVTRGPGRHAWMANSPTVGIRITPIDFHNFSRVYQQGTHAVITKTRSYSPDALDPKIKHYSRMNFSLAELEANDIDPGSMPILRDERGSVTEGSGYNVFIVTDGFIRSPADRSILKGVSREVVYSLAARLGISVVQEDLEPYDFYFADEVFFATTPWCLLPVTMVDLRRVGNGEPGKITSNILASWGGLVGVDVVEQAKKFGLR